MSAIEKMSYILGWYYPLHLLEIPLRAGVAKEVKKAHEDLDPSHIVTNCIIWVKTYGTYTMCPRSSDPFYIVFLLYKTGHYFLDIQ